MNISIDKQIGMEVQKVLGRGSFATVYYCVDQQTQKSYAVKVFHKKDFTKHRLKSFKKQAEILASIEHKNVVKFSSFKQTDSSLYLVMQYIPGGTLKQLITERQQNNKKFNDEEISLILKSILEGIQYLHKFNIIHRDLKPENILVADPGDLGSIKIVDFGLSAQIQAGSPTNVKSQCGTLLYMAPEILYQPSYSKAVDIWSCAVIMYILYTGAHPIHTEGMKSQQFKQKLKTCCFPKISNSLAENFIKNLSKIQYTERYSVNQALRHPWITRNQQDQIPLSVNQSIQSFNVSNTISHALKFVLNVGQYYQHSCQIPQQYRRKTDDFAEKNQQCRVRSPSYKKNRRRVDENLTTLKQLLHQKQKAQQQDNTINQLIQPQSPVLIKHQKLFLRLFDKPKEDIKSSTVVLQSCKKIQLWSENNEKIQSERKIIQEDEQSKSPMLISSSSYITTRNNIIANYDVDLPLIKIKYDKKQKGAIGIRKLNSLRQENSVKLEQNYSYFKNSFKNSQQKNRDTIGSSKSKRINNKVESLNQQMFNKNNLKKPQTAERGKGVSKGKQTRPLIFGSRGTFS